MLDYEHARATMVERQLKRRGVRDDAVLEAMRAVPREAFVDPAMQEWAYEDSALPIAAGQTISQPYVVALMLEAARPRPADVMLEIGAGSGYAAAVAARIVRKVFTVERHASLADAARERLARLGCDNVEVSAGDGSRGLADEAPFDVILVAAVGPRVPPVLKQQLAIGGRLVMPVGEAGGEQRLVRVVRSSQDRFDEDDLGPVTFVPLIGEAGWPDAESARRPREPRSFRPPRQASVPELIRAAAEPLPELDDARFAAPFDRFAAARVVLLGECSHGSSEFYRARAAITRRLVETHGFRIVAAEADWPDAASVNRFAHDRPHPEWAEPPFRRFPTWMWRNEEFDGFVQWLRGWNRASAPELAADFYGLDLYNLAASIEAVLRYLGDVDPEAAAVARERYACLTPWAREPQAYGRMALSAGYAECEAAVVKMLSDLVARRLEYAAADAPGFLDASANARLVKNAEAYYRAMYYGAAESWNLRDTHMFETLCALLDAHGSASKAVVWAHNSHIGDARRTDMGVARGELNLGQLCRERFGEQAALIGFGTHAGTVTCASDWDAPMEVKAVNPSRPDSYERLSHDAGVGRFLLDLREGQGGEARYRLLAPRLERFIGVIYRPDTERWSHYAECSLAQQFDAYVWFDETSAVTPLPTRLAPGAEETYPFGL